MIVQFFTDILGKCIHFGYVAVVCHLSFLVFILFCIYEEHIRNTCFKRFLSFYDGCRMRSRKCLPFRSNWFTSGFHRGSCCPVICVSLFHVVVLSFEFWVLIVWLRGTSIFLYFIFIYFFFHVKSIRMLQSWQNKKDKT